MSVVLLAALFCCTACTPAKTATEASSAKPNIILVVLDTLRLDFTGIGGREETLTPRLKLTLTPYALYSRDSDKVDG